MLLNTFISNNFVGAPTVGGGSIPTVAANNGGAANGSTYATASVSITPGGSNRYILVAIQYYGVGGDPTSVIFNTSETLGLLGSGVWFDSNGRQAFYGLKQPSATTANVVVVFPGTEGEYAISVVCYQDVNQTTPLTATSFDQGSSQNQTESITTSATDLAVLGLCFDGSVTVTAGAGIAALDANFGGGSGASGTVIGHGVAGSPTTSLTIHLSSTTGTSQGLMGFAIHH